MTSFSRLAKVIKGYTPPVGWIERAFASIITAINSVLPEYTISDVDKVLTIDKDEGHEVTKHIINEQSVTTNASGRADLAANSWDFSGLEANEEVTVLIGGVGATFTFLDGSLWGASDEQITDAGRLLGFSHSATFTISCSKAATEYDPVLDWKAVRQTPVVGTNDKGKYLHTNDSTGDLEWGAVRQTPAVGADDKDKYLHTNASTGALEWATAGGGSSIEVINASALGVLDKTYAQINSLVSTKPCFVWNYDAQSADYQVLLMPVVLVGERKGNLTVKCYDIIDGSFVDYIAATENDYPALPNP